MSDRIRVTEDLIRKLESKSVLEVGAGDYSFQYVKAGDGVSWKKADLAASCDVICDLNSDKLVLPFDDETFDLVICTEVLEHLLWPQRLLNEAKRILTSGGKLVVSVPNSASLSYRIAWMMGRIPSCAASGNLPPEFGSTAYERESGELTGGHVIDFSLKRIVSLLRFAGFEVLRLKGSGIIWHWQLLPHWLVPVSLSSNIICLCEK